MPSVAGTVFRTWTGARRLTNEAWRQVASFVRLPTGRHRLAIVGAALLVLAYALSVLGDVMFTPEIDIRCAFTPVVNHFYREFLYPQHHEESPPTSTIVQAVR